MSNIDKQAYRSDGGDIGTGRLREIADNPYGDEEKCWLAKRVLALLDDLEVATDACNGWQRKFADADERLEAAEKRIADLEARTVTLPENITSANSPEVFEISAEAERLGLRGTYASYAVGWNARRIAGKEALREALQEHNFK